jgi:maleylpyruvate isomerase
VTTDPLVLLPEVDRAVARLLATARTLDGAGLAAPSLLPGWTRGHVLSHLARSADGQLHMLTGARTGVATPPYANEQARADGIEAGAARPLDEQLADLEASAGRLSEAFAATPAEVWTVSITGRRGESMRAAALVWGRLREVEVHHVDLDAGYGPADWPEAFTLRLLHELESGFAAAPPVRLSATDLDRAFALGSRSAPAQDPPVTVAGPGSALASWLIGRSDGATLTVAPDGRLPPVPAWK